MTSLWLLLMPLTPLSHMPFDAEMRPWLESDEKWLRVGTDRAALIEYDGDEEDGRQQHMVLALSPGHGARAYTPLPVAFPSREDAEGFAAADGENLVVAEIAASACPAAFKVLARRPVIKETNSNAIR